MGLKWLFNQIEEYQMNTHELISRRLKKKAKLGVSEIIEVGEPESLKLEGMISSNCNPLFLQEDQPDSFVFKIRNLFDFKFEMFSVSVDSEKQELVIRTSNKRYFKRFQIGELVRMEIKLDEKAVKFEFHNSVLLIFYQKPVEVLYKEAQRKAQFEKMNAKNPQEGDLEGNL